MRQSKPVYTAPAKDPQLVEFDMVTEGIDWFERFGLTAHSARDCGSPARSI